MRVRWHDIQKIPGGMSQNGPPMRGPRLHSHHGCCWSFSCSPVRTNTARFTAVLAESCRVHFAETVGETDVAPFARCRRKGQFLQICTEEEVRDTACRNNNDRDRKPHILVLEGTGVVMSEQGPVPMVSIPTAMQQRLYWKPVEGAMFRHMNQFVALLEVYSFATGKRYKRKAVRNSDKRKKATFICIALDSPHAVPIQPSDNKIQGEKATMV